VQGSNAPGCVLQQHQQLQHVLLVAGVCQHLGSIACEGAQVTELCKSKLDTAAALVAVSAAAAAAACAFCFECLSPLGSLPDVMATSYRHSMRSLVGRRD
jgi:hypothetical protein